MKKFILLLTIISTSAFAALSDLDKADVSSTNILKNPGFESGLADWTKTGGTWALQSSGSKLGFGKGGLCWDSNAAGQKLKSTIATIPNALKGKNGEMKLSIQTPTGTSTHILRVSDGTNQIGNSVNVSTSTAFQTHSLNLVVPTSGGVGIEIESVASNEPEICLDLGYIGEATNLQNVAQAKHVGTLKYAATALCEWSVSTATFTSYSADTDCPTPTVTENLQAPSTKIPAFKMTVTAGSIYRIIAKGAFNQTGNYWGQWRFSDGTDVTDLANVSLSVTGAMENANGVATAIYKPTTSGEKTIEIQAKSDTGTYATKVRTVDADLVFEVEQFPSQSQLAVNSLQADFGWIDGGNVVITATTTNPTKSTTTVDKFWYKRTGEDAQFRLEYVQSGSGSSGSGDYLFELPAGLQIDTTKVQVFSTVVGLNSGYLSSNSLGSCKAVSSVFASSLEGQVVAYDSTHVRCIGTDITSTGSSGSGFYGMQQSISYSMRFSAPISGWSENQKAPTLIGSVTSGASGALRIESATIANNGTCSIASQTGNWISSVNHVGPGGCEVNFVAGTFSSTPVCSFNSLGGGRSFIHSGSNTASQLPYVENYRADTDTTPDADFTMMCIGPRP